MDKKNEEVKIVKKKIGGVHKVRPDKPFMMPKAVLMQVNEYCHGAFFLISFNDKGLPVINAKADTPIHGRAIRDFCVEYFAALGEAEKRLMKRSFINEIMLEDSEEENFDDDFDEDDDEENGDPNIHA